MKSALWGWAACQPSLPRAPSPQLPHRRTYGLKTDASIRWNLLEHFSLRIKQRATAQVVDFVQNVTNLLTSNRYEFQNSQHRNNGKELSHEKHVYRKTFRGD